MADFCNKCANNNGFPEPEIDVKKKFDELKPGYWIGGMLCEGCGLRGIAKTEEGELQVAYPDKPDWVTEKIEDYG